MSTHFSMPASPAPTNDLRLYGLTEARAAQLPPATVPARVVRADRGAVLAVTPSGSLQLRVHPGLDPRPTVGDWLAVNPPADADPAGAPPRIAAVLPRESLLRRAAADANGPQALAANVDLVLITVGLDRPVRSGRVDRVAAQAWDAGAQPILVLTKSAGVEVDPAPFEMAHPGVPVLVTSALEGQGVTEVADLVAGRTAVLIGESGAGKSTLTNVLLGRREMDTGEVRAGDHKGRHTTTARQLHLVPGPAGGAIIDTPGIRSVGLWTDAESVDASFTDIEELATQCRFSDCAHGGEPGCAVQAALATGDLPPARYESWRHLQREIASSALRSSPHQARKYGKQFSRMAKQEAARKRRQGS